jgi:hypothetical protein
MATAITPEQIIELENYPRHQRICKQWVKDIATYIRGLNSGDEAWAKRRIIAAGIAHHPNSQDYLEWTAQMTATLKGQVIWEATVEATIDALNANNGAKYDAMANEVFVMRSQRIEF